MYLSLGIGVILSVLQWNQSVAGAQTLGGAKFVLIIQVSVIGITILFIWLIARCHRNWARWVFVILAVLGLPSYASTLGQMLRSRPIAGIVSIAQLTTEVLAFF